MKNPPLSDTHVDHSGETQVLFKWNRRVEQCFLTAALYLYLLLMHVQLWTVTFIVSRNAEISIL